MPGIATTKKLQMSSEGNKASCHNNFIIVIIIQSRNKMTNYQ